MLDVRQALGKPLDPVTAGLMTASVLTVNVHWREFLRYRSTPATSHELTEVIGGVEWLRENYEVLWR